MAVILLITGTLIGIFGFSQIVYPPVWALPYSRRLLRQGQLRKPIPPYHFFAAPAVWFLLLLASVWLVHSYTNATNAYLIGLGISLVIIVVQIPRKNPDLVADFEETWKGYLKKGSPMSNPSGSTIGDLVALEHKAAADDREAQYELGHVYFFDWMAKLYGVELDHRVAAKWYEKAANQGHPGAQCQLAYLYLETIDEEKWKIATDLLAKAAQQGDVTAMANLGRVFANAKGVPYLPETAEGWLTEAADKGGAEEQYYLGLFYFYGGMGLKQSYEKAAHWYTQAALRDHPQALQGLVDLYEKGFGVPRDFFKADEYRERLEKIQKEDDSNTPDEKENVTYPDALRVYARLYHHGLLCPKNEGRARDLLEEASRREQEGNLDAEANRARIQLEGKAYAEWVERGRKNSTKSLDQNRDSLI